MTEQTIFTPDQGAATPTELAPNVAVEQNAVPQVPSIPTELQGIVGEGKKFSSMAALASGYSESQSFIETMKGENANYRTELEKRKSAEELLQDIRTASQPVVPTSPGVEVNKDVVSEIVQQQLNQARAQEVAKTNNKSVIDAFTANYGEKAEAQFMKLAQDNDMSIPEMEALVASKPNMVLKLAGLSGGTAPKSNSPLQGDVNTMAMNTPQNNELSAKLPLVGATTKQLGDAWAATRAKVYKDYDIKS